MPYVPSSKTPGLADDREILDRGVKAMVDAIGEVSMRHKYDGAFAGELNYSLTRLLQEIPRDLVARGQFNEEMRYWMQPLLYGVLLDVALEHKLRVNTAYEAAQIVKSGDCYDTPHYTRLVEVVDGEGAHVGYQHVMMKRSDATIDVDVLPGKIVVE